MGGNSSKVKPVEEKGGGESTVPEKGGVEKGGGRKEVLETVASKKLIFDAHCHYTDYMQKTEGITKLCEAMEANGIGFSNMCATAFKKTWVGKPKVGADGMMELPQEPVHPFYDDGDLYYYTACDGEMWRDKVQAEKEFGPDSMAKLSIMASGINLGDYSAGDMAKRKLAAYPTITAFGEIVLQSDDINNVTIKGGNWTFTTPAIEQILKVCGEHKPPLPFVFYSDARSATTKPYRQEFEYLEEVEMVAERAAKMGVKCLWCGCGLFPRGMWADYEKVLTSLLGKYDNLYISFTPEIVMGKYAGINREAALDLAEKLQGKIVLGTTVRGLFVDKPPKAFGESSYSEQTEALKKFANQIETRAGPAAAAFLRYRTACTIFGFELPTDESATSTALKKVERGATLKALMKKEMSVNTEKKQQMNFLSALAYGGSGGSTNVVCPPSVIDKKWDTIDCHLHLLDFLQKSSGTTAALKAMDGCDCKKAVLFGMPCCKKWCFYRPQQPLYYQDDNGPCYVYAYADQMVADSWLALCDEERARFAPTFASFDPTDLAAIGHVRRMYQKYPLMWRGIGEVMCRHDDLTTMLLGKEIPTVNHPALDYIYEFCIEKDLPILVHHNSDRVGDNDADWEYLDEVKEVLRKYPKLKFVWVHAGVSRRCSEPMHHQMIESMCDEFDNLKVDISWVVWEDVICDENGKVKQGWIDCIQKHHTKFFIGSDNVAQFFPIMDTSTNLLASNITKYYQLFDKLTEEAGNNVAYNNAENQYFANWKMPTCNPPEGHTDPWPYARMPSFYDTECLDPKSGSFVKGATDLDDDGKY